MKIAARTILFLAFASLTEAHNVRVGNKLQEHTHVETRTTPSEGSHVTPPRSDSHVTPPRSGSHVTSPRSGSHVTPPRSDSHVTPPRSDSHVTPPRSGSHVTPPRSETGTHVPPRHKEENKARTTPRHGPGLAYGEACSNDWTMPNEDCFSGVCVLVGGYQEVPEDNVYQCGDCMSHEDCAGHPDGSRCIWDQTIDMMTNNVPPKCLPAGAYGDACQIGEDCESTHCGFFYDVDNVYQSGCAECTMNTDCPADRPRCIYSTAGPATCEPLQDVAQPCNVDEDCLSNVCYHPAPSMDPANPTPTQPVCGECNYNNPCAVGERCFEMDVPHSYCAPKLGYNETCNVAEDCLSDNCHTRPQQWDPITQTFVGELVMLCADCGASSECGEGEYCHWEYDYETWTYYDAPSCELKLQAGEQCSMMFPDSCVSNYCWSPPPDPNATYPSYQPMYEAASIVCAECTPWMGTASGCAPDQRCANDPDVAPYCAPKGEWGESCSMAEDCVSNLCVSITSDDPAYMYMSIFQCADCQGSYDCRDETRASYDSTRPRCVYDPNMSEPGYCDAVGVIGDVCTESLDCVSNICEYKHGPMRSFCSECTVDSDCAAGEACFLVPAGGNTCAPKAQNGATCEHDTDCASGFCAELFQGLHKKCVGCRHSDDCYDHPDGPVCIYNPHLQDPPVCGPLGGSGDYCNESWDCASNSCIYAPDSYDGTCA